MLHVFIDPGDLFAETEGSADMWVLPCSREPRKSAVLSLKLIESVMKMRVLTYTTLLTCR
jgi:hypothetical protein